MADSDSAAAVNAATLELLERRIAERVTEQARRKVIGHHVVVGTTVAAVLGLFGWNALSWGEREVKSRIQTQITDMTTELKNASEKFATQQRDVNGQLDVLKVLAGRAGKTLDEVEETLKTFQPKSRRLEQVITDIDELEAKVRPIRGAGATADQNRADLERISRELSTLAEQVSKLVLQAQRAPAPGGTGEDYGALVMNTRNVASGSANIARDIAASRATTTVYIQVSGFARELVDELRQALLRDGFNVPAAETISSAAALFEVRYFYEADKAAAERLAQAITGAAGKVIPGGAAHCRGGEHDKLPARQTQARHRGAVVRPAGLTRQPRPGAPAAPCLPAAPVCVKSAAGRLSPSGRRRPAYSSGRCHPGHSQRQATVARHRGASGWCIAAARHPGA